MKPLKDLSSLAKPGAVISLSGAGGKTTLMFRLSRAISGAVIVTTTTKVWDEQTKLADSRLTIGNLPAELPGKVTWVSPSLNPQNGKILGCDAIDFAKLCMYADRKHAALIYEADGSAQKHIKAPAGHEPSIFPQTTHCCYLIGLDVLGKPISGEFVHRPEIFAGITGSAFGEIIREETILHLMEHPNGGLKNMPQTAKKIAVLVHASEYPEAAEYITKKITQYDEVLWI